ncbi:hydrogenase nickel incorporation protein [compost metagenome]|uniref:Hydrogenase maturation factor HypA n=2 Tax=Serratia TaxID=613 RepID=A0A380AZT8_9GAMM|nr:hydrogenase nickel incorporation protein [Serratia quinivorans]SUI90795.1 hydrogenase nickel incorporation protein [Serratia quinivorans]VEI69690.1 hydrogenase nickel incorporation protein [Serratia quinivorans]
MTDDDSRFDKYVIGGLASYLQREGNNAFIAINGGRMHEITLCQHAMEIMQQQARQNNAQRITAVWFEIGAFSCVEAESLRFCFDMVCRDTLAEGCELHLAEQKAQCWCHDCQSDVELLIPQVLVCPHCTGRNLRVQADDGLQIKRLEIE